MSDKQIQKAGDNSAQVQMVNPTFVCGIDEKRVREVCSEMALETVKVCTTEATAVALDRIEQFTTMLLPRVEQIERKFNSFSDPSFQTLLRKAQLVAACSERPVDYEMLSELLVHRINNKNNTKKKASISKAVEIINDIDIDSLCALTILHCVCNFIPVTGNISDGISTLADLYDKLDYNKLPSDRLWIDNLSILGCMTTASFFTPNSFEDRFCKVLDGYMCVGIKRGSENYDKAVQLLKDNNFGVGIFVEHELLDGYVRLQISQKDRIENLSYTTISIIDGIQHTRKNSLTESQKKCLRDIFEMYSKDGNLKNKVRQKFIDLLMSHVSIKVISKWWNDFNTAFSLTSVGKVIAHANAQRIDNTLPNLDE